MLCQVGYAVEGSEWDSGVAQKFQNSGAEFVAIAWLATLLGRNASPELSLWEIGLHYSAFARSASVHSAFAHSASVHSAFAHSAFAHSIVPFSGAAASERSL